MCKHDAATVDKELRVFLCLDHDEPLCFCRPLLGSLPSQCNNMAVFRVTGDMQDQLKAFAHTISMTLEDGRRVVPDTHVVNEVDLLCKCNTQLEAFSPEGLVLFCRDTLLVKGVCILQPPARLSRRKKTVVRLLAVHDDLRDCGMGTLLWCLTEMVFFGQNAMDISVELKACMMRAKTFWQRLGFMACDNALVRASWPTQDLLRHLRERAGWSLPRLGAALSP